VSLFYLAFYEGDMMKLRAELTVRLSHAHLIIPLVTLKTLQLIQTFVPSQSLFLADTCRRVLMEFVVPLLLMLRQQRKACPVDCFRRPSHGELLKMSGA
jgi:hypothetical protein